MNASTLWSRSSSSRLPALLAVLASGISLVSPASAQDDLEALVDSIAAEHVDTGKLAGMSIGVTRGSETLLLKAYGYADLEWDVPMPADAIHEIGSVTKQFTSAAMMQLWAEGKVDLDADVTTYLPDYDTQGRHIPVRRLFDHTSGIKGYTEMASFGQLVPQALPRDTLVTLFEAVPLEFEPGHALIYNNSAYFLLGLIIEEISGQSYEDYLEEHIFPRAGMDNSSYCTNDEVWERRAHGYQPGPDGLDRAGYLDHRWPYAAGSLCSTVEDLIAWNRALHGGEVVSEEAYVMMTTPVPLEDGTPIRYAMGLTNYTGASGHVIEHGGGILGFLSSSRYYPEHDVIVVVLLNTAGPPGPDAVANAIGEHLFGVDNGPVAGTYAGDLGQLVGKYRGPARGQTLTAVVTEEDGALMLAAAGEPTSIEYLDGTTFFNGNRRAIFETDGGQATALRIDHIGGHYVLARVDEEAEAAARFQVSAEALERYVGRYEIGPDFYLDITVEDGQAYAQATGQQRLPLFADSETEFHLEVADAGLEFVVEESGQVDSVIMRQGGGERVASRVPSG